MLEAAANESAKPLQVGGVLDRGQAFDSAILATERHSLTWPLHFPKSAEIDAEDFVYTLKNRGIEG